MPLKKNQQIKHLSWGEVDSSLRDLRDKIRMRITPKKLYVIEHGDQVYGSLLASYLGCAFIDNRDMRSKNLMGDISGDAVFFTQNNSLYNASNQDGTLNVVFMNYMNEDAGVDFDIPDVYHQELTVPVDDIYTKIVFPWQK